MSHRGYRRTRGDRMGPSSAPYDSTKLVVADVGGWQPRLAQQEAKARVDHRRRARDVGAHVGEASFHALAGHGVDEAPRERESGIGRGQRRRYVLVGERHRHREPRRVPRPERFELVEEEAVARGADAEEDVTVPRPEVTFAAGERQDRHYAGDATAPRDAEDVLAHVGMERRVAQRREEAEARAL